MISKRVTSLRNFLVAESALQELAEFVHEKYFELMKASEDERARGYLKLFRLLVEVLSDMIYR